jgi:nicotinate phosphoribosyltransferase
MAYPRIYNQSLALLTDQYQMTMSYAYWKMGLANKEAVFHLFFRKKPFGGGFAVACGLEAVIDYLQNFRYDSSDLAYLQTVEDIEGKRMFHDSFLDYLQNLRFTCSVDAVCEGTAVFPYQPLLRIQGPIIQCQLLETPLLNLINFPTIIATKAARIRLAAGDDEVIEFGLRRAQGIDGAITAARSAFVGGCDSTSNILAGKLYGIPIRGTHSHSWVMIFDSELESFQTYAEALPANCVFLVDTYNTIVGVQNAIKVGQWLREKGYQMLGIRLDSGDLSYLSAEARRLLDEAGFQKTKIVASNELDEILITDLKRQGAKVTVWGVGTNLVTAKDQPALDGVYKISAVRDPGGEWKYKLKLSEQLSKVSNPGILQVRRFYNDRENVADVIYDLGSVLGKTCQMVDPFDPTRRKILSENLQSRDLLQPIFKEGKLVYSLPTLKQIQDYTKQELSHFHPGIKRFFNPHIYPVGMEKSLYELKTELVEKVRAEELH